MSGSSFEGLKRRRLPDAAARGIVSGLLLLALCGCEPQDAAKPEPPVQPAPVPRVEWSSQQRELYFGIPVQVRFQPAHAELERRVWAYLGHVDDVFNDYRNDSELGKLNATLATQREAAVSDELAEALRFAREAHRKTLGAFDATIGPLRDLWRKASRNGRLPTEEEIGRARAVCGFEKVRLDGRTVRTSVPGIRFDFGGFIKGDAVDRAIRMLRSAGVRAAMVQVGGETAVFGLSSRGRPHVLGIQHPIEMDQIWSALADPGTGLSASTSGNYRAPLEIGGQLVYHIFDPRTGRPADARTLSVSVVFRETGRNAWADVLSTAGAILPTGEFLELVAREGGEALILEDAGVRSDPAAVKTPSIRERATNGWNGLVTRE